MTVLFLHGSFSSPADIWWPWLKSELENLGHKVFTPQFPVDKWAEVGELKPEEYRPSADLNIWFNKFEKIKTDLLADEKRFVVGHSLGPLFLLHLLERYKISISGAILTAPFFEIYGKSAIVEKFNQPFYKSDFNFGQIKRLMPDSTVFYSDNDPYVEESKSLDFAQKLGSKTIKLHGLGHMGSEAGLTEFPEVLKRIKNYVADFV